MIAPAPAIVVGDGTKVSLRAADGLRFDSTPLVQLTGLVRAAEFESSIARCNAAYAQSWQRWGPRFLFTSAFLGWGLFLILSLQDQESSFPEPGIFMAVFAGFGVVMSVGMVWGSYLERQRTERLRVAVAAESAYYNGAQRAQQFGPLRAPMSWTLGSVVTGRTNRGHDIMATCIDINLGPMVVAAPQPMAGQVFVQPQQQQQPVAYGSVAPLPQQPYQPAAYGQPVPAPYQAPPAYSPQAQFPGEARRVGALYPQAQAHGHAHAPAPLATPAWTDEGQPFKQPVFASPSGSQQQQPQAQPAFPSGSVWSCERCARAAQPDDRFCSACGGPVARRA